MNCSTLIGKQICPNTCKDDGKLNFADDHLKLNILSFYHAGINMIQRYF